MHASSRPDDPWARFEAWEILPADALAFARDTRVRELAAGLERPDIADWYRRCLRKAGLDVESGGA